MAVVLDPQGFGRVEGMLARAALAGGPPRQLAESVLAADWRPDGGELAIVRSGNGRDVLEYPIGQALYDPSPGHITHIRVAPAGDAVAVLLHPVSGDTAGSVVLVDLQGRATTLSSGWNSVLGLAWSPTGDEVWFTGTRTGAAQAIHAVSRGGKERLLLGAPATLTLHDVSRDGRALVSRDAWGAGVMARAPGSATERDLSWLDGSTAWDLSADGTTTILEESWEGGGAARSIYLRTLDGAPAVRLGEGVPLALSPDKQWVLSAPVAADHLVLLPTGVGQARRLPTGPIASYFPAARFLPDGRRFLMAAAEKSAADRIYLQSIDGGEPEPSDGGGRVRTPRRPARRRPLRDPRHRPPPGGVLPGRRPGASRRRRRVARPADRGEPRRRVALRAERPRVARRGGPRAPAHRPAEVGLRAPAAGSGRRRWISCAS